MFFYNMLDCQKCLQYKNNLTIIVKHVHLQTCIIVVSAASVLVPTSNNTVANSLAAVCQPQIWKVDLLFSSNWQLHVTSGQD